MCHLWSCFRRSSHLELVPDFLLHSDVEAPTEQYELVLIQAEAEETRLNALDLYDILGIKPPVLDDSFYWALGKSPEAAAVSVRESRLASSTPAKETTEPSSSAHSGAI